MKILHTSDWHLGNVFHGHDRTEEHRHFFDWLLATLRERQPDVMLVAGDIFDSPNPSAAAERLFYDFLLEATESVEGLQIVVIAGNHDSAGRLEAPAALLDTHNIYIRGTVRRTEKDEPDYEHFVLPLRKRGEAEPEAVCLALPYLRSADCPPGAPADGLRHYFDQLRRVADKRYGKRLPRVAVAHFYAAGAEINAEEHSERLVVGGQDCAAPDVTGKGLAYVALGHIHRSQQVVPGMWYAGSALPMSFTERGYRHGALWIELDDEGEAQVSPLIYEPLRRLLSVPASGTATPAALPELLDQLPKREKRDDGSRWAYLEIRVEESQPEPGLMQTVSEMLEERAVRFCRMVRVLPEAKSREQRPDASLDTLRRLSPLDMARRVFDSRYHAPLPTEMESRFSEAMEEAIKEE